MRKMPPVWISLLLLLAALSWRMIGAPVTAEDFRNLETPLWQAKIQLPVRLARIWSLWQPAHISIEPGSEQAGRDTTVMVYITQEERMAEMTLPGYVRGVVAAEMPAQYHLEALKAQAVAARTRLLSQKEKGGCSRHPGADICTDSAHCQGYATLADCQSRWGDSYEAYRDRIVEAEQETRSEILTYEGELITVLYHAMSGGKTEAAATVFAQDIPYLISVESAGEESARGFWQESGFSYDELAQKIRPLMRKAISPERLRQTFSISEYTESGRVRAVQAGEETILATELRRALGLRSTWFSISMDESGVTFLQRGYGHGVGMSQVGANSMAADGADYAGILTHYYPGTVLEKR